MVSTGHSAQVLAVKVNKCCWCPKLVNGHCLRILLRAKLFLTILNHFSLFSVSLIFEYESHKGERSHAVVGKAF